MLSKRVYKGKVISQSIWGEREKGKPTPMNIEMAPGLAGNYSWRAKLTSGSKILHYQGKFDTAVIQGDRISFLTTRPVSINGNKINGPEIPLLVIEFEEGEVCRLLSEDRWFRTESWFKVIINELQLSIL